MVPHLPLGHAAAPGRLLRLYPGLFLFPDYCFGRAIINTGAAGIATLDSQAESAEPAGCTKQNAPGAKIPVPGSLVNKERGQYSQTDNKDRERELFALGYRVDRIAESRQKGQHYYPAYVTGLYGCRDLIFCHFELPAQPLGRSDQGMDRAHPTAIIPAEDRSQSYRCKYDSHPNLALIGEGQR